ncbi:hypothetical protein ABC345_01710 [Shouchella sp. 1P09AA]
MNYYLESINTIKPFASYTKVTSTKTNEHKANKAWISYHKHTPNWSKADKYTITSGKSFSMSGTYKYNGFSATISVKHSTSATVSYPADPKRYSKLGVRHDLTYQKWKHVERTAAGKHVKTWYTETVFKRGSAYIATAYQ